MRRAQRLRRLAPPSRRLPLLFTHIPKCAGSSFRNDLLLEFTRTQRAPADFACILYRDATFRENRTATPIERHGPACLTGDGTFTSQSLVAALMIAGLVVFAVVFGVNSAINSYLIAKYSTKVR